MANDVDRLAVELCGIQMKTPVMTASGTFGFGEEFAGFVDLNRLGALVVKGTTLKPRSGNRGVRIAETPSGMLNSIGLENPGVEVFLRDTLPRLKKTYDVPIIVNISGAAAQEYGELAQLLDVDGVAAVELNISCPNVKEGGLAFGADEKSAASVVEEAKRSTRKPVIVKLSPNVADIAAMAKAVEEAGADAISLINTLTGMVIDTKTWRPALGNLTGGLSGPAVRPVAVRMVWQAAQAVKVPVIGMGGILTADDAVQFFLAGASAVAVGFANFVHPRSIETITDGLESYLAKRRLAHIGELVGKLKLDVEKGKVSG